MVDEAEYKKLVAKAEVILKNYPHLDAYDIVNDVLLECLESGKENYFHEIVKKVQFKAKHTGANLQGTTSFKNGILKNRKYSKAEQVRVCKKCHEPLPISAFAVVRRKKKNSSGDAYGIVNEILFNCIECQRKYVKEYRAKKKAEGISLYVERRRKKDPLYSKKVPMFDQKSYVGKWQAANQEKMRVNQKRYYEKNKARIAERKKINREKKSGKP